MNAPSSPRLALIGLSGSGKTEVGRRVARALGRPVLDSDALVAEEAGCSVSEIFAREGEAGFRDRETRVLAGISRRKGPLVVSLGGGVVVRDENRKLLKDSFYVVWVQVDPEVAARRLQGSKDRPLLETGDPQAVLEDLERARRPLYEETAHARVTSAPDSTPETVAEAVIQALGAR